MYDSNGMARFSGGEEHVARPRMQGDRLDGNTKKGMPGAEFAAQFGDIEVPGILQRLPRIEPIHRLRDLKRHGQNPPHRPSV
jgi:hypothetical protein